MNYQQYAEMIVGKFADIIGDEVHVHAEQESRISIRCAIKFIQGLYDASEPDPEEDEKFESALHYLRHKLQNT
jgi:hypothetical protein